MLSASAFWGLSQPRFPGKAPLCVVLPGRGGGPVEYKRVWASSPRAQAGLCSLRDVGGSSPPGGSARWFRNLGDGEVLPRPGGGSKGYLAVPVVLAVPTFRPSEVSSLFWGENMFCCLLASAMS